MCVAAFADAQRGVGVSSVSSAAYSSRGGSLRLSPIQGEGEDVADLVAGLRSFRRAGRCLVSSRVAEATRPSEQSRSEPNIGKGRNGTESRAGVRTQPQRQTSLARPTAVLGAPTVSPSASICERPRSSLTRDSPPLLDRCHPLRCARML